MTIKTTVVEKAEVVVPHDVMVRFIRSLGLPVPAGAKLAVYQGGYPSIGAAIGVAWEVAAKETTREVSGTSKSDLDLLDALDKGLDKDDTGKP